MMKRHLSLIILAGLCAASSSFAAKYGTAGCGLGSIVFNDKPGMIQIFAATTNGIGGQTFGMTSGTSNCVESHSGDMASLYIEANEESLRKDIARGNGETLTGLSQVYDCGNTSLLGAKLQQNFGAIYPSNNASAAQISQSIRNTIRQDSELSNTCKVSG